MRLSVVVPCHNAADTVGTQLLALARQRWSEPWELIVVNNASTDGTAEVVMGFADRIPNLRLISAHRKRGAAYARNEGARIARGTALAFCDADDEVGEGWVAAIGEAVLRHGFVACRMDSTKLSSRRARAAMGSRRQQQGLLQFGYVPYLPFAGSGGLAVLKSIHDLVGGFSEDMQYLEDCDYCWRIQRTGTKLVFASDAILHVRHRESAYERFRQARSWGEYNVLLMKVHQQYGMPRPHWTTGLKLWLGLAKGLRRVHRTSYRDKWIRALGRRLGHLRGSIKYRMFAP